MTDPVETWAHRTVGVAVALGMAHVHPLPIAGVAVTVATAAVFSGGWTSPDVDNQRAAKAVDTLVPDELLGHGGPLGHRQLAHSWMLPAAAWWTWVHYMPPTALLVTWAALGALYGWVSHLIPADLLFGQRGIGHAKGIPLFLWWGHVGLGLKADGWPEKAAGLTAAVLAFWFAAGLARQGLPYQPHPITLPNLVASWPAH